MQFNEVEQQAFDIWVLPGLQICSNLFTVTVYPYKATHKISIICQLISSEESLMRSREECNTKFQSLIYLGG